MKGVNLQLFSIVLLLFSIYLAYINGGPAGFVSYIVIFALLVGIIGVAVGLAEPGSNESAGSE